MLLISLLKAKQANSVEALSRRARWQHPGGLRVIAEYWLACSDPMVITVCEADSRSEVIAANAEWSDLFDVTVVQAMTAERGLELAEWLQPGLPPRLKS